MLKIVTLMAAVVSAAAQCICETPVPGDPLCAYQYVLVGKALNVNVPGCGGPLRPDSGELVDFEEFAFSYVNFEVDAIIKQPLLEDSPNLTEGQIVQIYSPRTVEACGFPMDPENSYIITAFLEELEGCLDDEDPLAQRLNLATTFCSENVENPDILEVLQFADDCGEEFGVETTDNELEEVVEEITVEVSAADGASVTVTDDA